MKRAFKFISRLLLIIAVLAFIPLFAACGTYVPPEAGADTPGINAPSENPDEKDPYDKPDQSGKKTFKVTLKKDKKPFDSSVYSSITSLSAVWTNLDDSKDVIYARFNEEGVASAQLDGDYRVTLSYLPKGYSYDPNAYITNNRKYEITVEMLPVISEWDESDAGLNHAGYKWFQLEEYGVYRITMGSGHEVKLRYKSTKDAYYGLESFCDIYANKVSAKMRTYVVNEGGYFGGVREVIIGGGAEASYTKNFRYSLFMNAQNYGYVGVEAESKDKTKVTVDFLYRMDEDRDDIFYTTIRSKWDFDAHDVESPTGTKREYRNVIRNATPAGTKPRFDSSLAYKDEEGFYRLKATDELFYVDFSGNIGNISVMRVNYVNSKNYYQLVKTYKAHLVGKVENGKEVEKYYYPVNDELIEMLTTYSAWNGTGGGYGDFFDGSGGLDATYQADESSVWMAYVCLFR